MGKVVKGMNIPFFVNHDEEIYFWLCINHVSIKLTGKDMIFFHYALIAPEDHTGW